MADIDALSRKIPNLCKVSPSVAHYHMEDVHRAGGVMGILGELQRGGLLHEDCNNVLGDSLRDTLAMWDIQQTKDETVKSFYRAAPGRQRMLEAFGQDAMYDDLDNDRAGGCIRDVEHAYSKDGGLAVLFGNLAADGCIVKTAGVPEGMLSFKGPARVFESENDAAAGIMGGDVKPGDVVVVRYEGPRGGPGMQEMLMPTSMIKAVGLADKCALITDGRFSGASSGLSIGHISPEAAEGGNIGLIEDGDEVVIDIPGRKLDLAVDESTLEARRAAATFKPKSRDRVVSRALQAYGALARSAAFGAVRDPSLVQPK